MIAYSTPVGPPSSCRKLATAWVNLRIDTLSRVARCECRGQVQTPARSGSGGGEGQAAELYVSNLTRSTRNQRKPTHCLQLADRATLRQSCAPAVVYRDDAFHVRSRLATSRVLLTPDETSILDRNRGLHSCWRARSPWWNPVLCRTPQPGRPDPLPSACWAPIGDRSSRAVPRLRNYLCLSEKCGAGAWPWRT
jgi:hypothetical protein